MPTYDDQKLLKNYLDKNYKIKDNKFFSHFEDTHQWGISISNTLRIIFNLDIIFCEEIFKNWAKKNGVAEDNLMSAFQPYILKTKFSPDVANDFRFYYNVDNGDREMILWLLNSIHEELKLDILIDLKNEILTYDDFFSVMHCVGYNCTFQLYENESIIPSRYFTSMNIDEIKFARKINPIWKKWVKKR